MTPERLAAVCQGLLDKLPKDSVAGPILVDQLRNEIDALTRERDEWKARYLQWDNGLTQERIMELLVAEKENARLAAEHNFLYEWFSDVFDSLEHEPPHEPSLNEIKWRATEERRERTRAQSAEFKLTADVAKLREAAENYLYPQNPHDRHDEATILERVLAETAP